MTTFIPSCRTIDYILRNDQPLHLDIFDPISASSDPAPAVIFIHGGGWKNGNPAQFHDHARRLAARGYLACSMQYRLAPHSHWPAQLHDCHDAFRYLLQHHAELRIDPHRIAVVGSSAGGHLAACLAMRDLVDSPVPAVVRPACVVDIHGIHHFPHRMYTLTDAMHDLFGGSPEQRPDLYHDASPIHFIDDRTPPMLLTHDPADPTVPCAQSAEFASALALAGRSFDFLATPGSGHGFIYNLQGDMAQRYWPPIERWLDRHLL